MHEIAPTGNWKSAGDVIRQWLNISAANLNDGQRQLIAEFWEVVGAWSAGQLTVEQAKSLTGDGWLRAQCLFHTSMDHPLWIDAMRLLDHVIATEDGPQFFTAHGWFSLKDIQESGGRIYEEWDSATGEKREYVQFPVGVDKVTGRTIWPSRERAVQYEAEHKPYVSPHQSEWFG